VEPPSKDEAPGVHQGAARDAHEDAAGNEDDGITHRDDLLAAREPGLPERQSHICGGHA
jgi:hypothetical protein